MAWKTKLGILLLCAGIASALPATAAEQKTDEGFESYSLGEVYVKGEKPPAVKEVTVTSEVTAEDIKATGSKTVPQALSHTPGVFVSTGRRSEPSISIRGLDQSRVLILVDGIPYYTTYTGKLDLNQFTTDNVAKIEVSKGAASILYGANALAGVVNIVTKQPTGKPYFEITGEMGEVDQYRASISHGMKKGIFSYWLNYSHDQSRGYGLSDDYVPGVVLARLNPGGNRSYVTQEKGLRRNADYEINSFWGKFGIEPAPGSEYFVNLRYITRDKGNTIAAVTPDGASRESVFLSPPAFTQWFRFSRYDDFAIDVSGQQKVTDKLTLKSKIYYHNHADNLDSYNDPWYTTMVSRSSYQDYTIGGNIIAELKPVEWNTMRMVFNYIGDSHKERADTYLSYDNYFSFTGSAGIEDEINIMKNFSVVLGGSYDWFHVTEARTGAGAELRKPPSMNSFNPMIGATYVFPDATKLFASVARKTRFPTLSNFYTSRGGNVDLKAESAINSTIGVSRPFGDLAWGQLAFYYNDISDYITRSSAAQTAPLMNYGDVVFTGVELNSEFYPMKDMVLRFGYTYNNATNESDGIENIGRRDATRVPFVPEHKVDLGFQYLIPMIKVKLDLNGSFLSKVYSQVPALDNPTQSSISVGSYFIMGARVSRVFFDHYEAYLVVNNLTDKNYAPETYAFPAPGRTIFGGITAKF